MNQETLTLRSPDGASGSLPVTWLHTLIIGSGAAGLNAAVQLHTLGIPDLCIITEGLDAGTSINTGSDKQTYYKLSLYGTDADAPRLMAETYFNGGSMHGDLALVEAAGSVRAFAHLVNLGVAFPCDQFGQFVGYKTDHDPRQRATSIGPNTSREMCRALIREVKRREIEVREGRLAVQLLIVGENGGRRAAGAIALNADGEMEAYAAENVVFATGGPGGLYQSSVYPAGHTGAIGVALLAGARAQSLPESQYGLASTKFRWNVSGTYMQVIPRFISTAADGMGEEREFLRPYFESAGAMHSMVFLKGYQWPFDSRKAAGGSSIIDLLAYQECVGGRRVFLDFRVNPDGFSCEGLSEEARAYLEKSGALLDSPIARLAKMNPEAIEVFRGQGIDIAKEPLEVAVCAQHNNGGLAANHWWESLNTRHLFPVGEVNGSHGVYRPGGSALNSGQVAGFRAAEFIAHRYRERTVHQPAARSEIEGQAAEFLAWIRRCATSDRSWAEERRELQERMSRAGAHIRALDGAKQASAEAWSQWRRMHERGTSFSGSEEILDAARTRSLCFAHAVYLDAIAFALESGSGSRGSAIVLDAQRGLAIHPKLGPEWRIVPENAVFREKVLESDPGLLGKVEHRWVPVRPLPKADAWFETAWARFQAGEIYD
jgi:succinate dehydrogenase/fumarate reductase flavoprotein subunit